MGSKTNPGFPCRLQLALRSVYAGPNQDPAIWNDGSNVGYISIHLVEKSSAGLASKLKGDLIDVECGMQPYKSCYSHAIRIIACGFDATRGNVDFACPAHDIPVGAESFDSVFCTELLEHVPAGLAGQIGKWPQPLRQMAALLYRSACVNPF